MGSPLVERAAARSKRGFGVPMDGWMRNGPLEPLVREAERSDAIVSDFLGREFASGTIQLWRGGQAHWSTAWSLTVLNAWLKRS